MRFLEGQVEVVLFHDGPLSGNGGPAIIVSRRKNLTCHNIHAVNAVVFERQHLCWPLLRVPKREVGKFAISESCGI